jgi:DNA-binding NarL/FixJ family response regulator
MIRVVVVDDHHLVRQGIRALLEKSEDVDVVGEAADGREAIDLVERLLPDVLVMDVAMPRLNGIEAAGRIHALGVPTRVIILSMYSDRSLVRQALHKGAVGYLLKRSVAEELVLAVRAASRGEVFLSPEVSRSVVNDLLATSAAPVESGPLDRLTAREREVLQLIAEGHTNRSIAQMLGLSIKTIEKHRSSLMTKLDIHDVAGLVRFAVKHRLVFLDA